MREPQQPESMRPPAGEWDVVRQSGLLPPGLRKRIGEAGGETQLLGFTIGAFDIAGRSLLAPHEPEDLLSPGLRDGFQGYDHGLQP